MKPYTLDELMKIFSKHAVDAIMENKRQLAEFRNNNPGSEIPEYLLNDFNLPYALLSMVEAIQKLTASGE